MKKSSNSNCNSGGSLKPLFVRVSRAFTLVEVLITLGIIGVVAAMTIPNLITAHQKKVTVTKLQKAISVLNQAYRMSYTDNGDATANEAMAMGAQAYFQQYWAPYIKTATICTTYLQCGYSSPSFDHIKGALGIVSPSTRCTFYTADGFLYVIGVSTTNPEGEVISSSTVLVDINGPKGPNRVGKDVFMLDRVIDDEKGGFIAPTGYNLADSDINRLCQKANWCDTCAEKIRRAGWQIDKSYPW